MSNKYTSGPGPLDGTRKVEKQPETTRKREKLNDKIKALDSTRVFKKITPKGDLSWYVKWISVILILVATSARAVGTIPHIDLWFGLFGTIGWFWVGMLWHDRALILLNGVLVTLIGIGLMKFYFGV
jgi:hypothetical protein|tara:strand:+ start:1191 stop:1571 length:381 start_codon:yes stop_codon:yes gene_type:complete